MKAVGTYFVKSIAFKGKIMFKRFITLSTICLCFSAYSQKVEDLKKSSGNHNRGSDAKLGSSGNKGYSNNSGGSNSEIDPGCLIDGCNILFNILSVIDFSELKLDEPIQVGKSYDIIPIPDSAKPREPLNRAEPNEPLNESEPLENRDHEKSIKKDNSPKKIPFEKMCISVRGSFYPSKFHVWVPEISGSKGHFSYSARYLSIAEQRLDKVDYYATFDVQPLQFNLINNSNFLLKFGIGGMAETFSNKIYFEYTTNANWRIGKKFDMGVEGRMALNNGLVRQEVSLHANYALWQKENKQLLVGLNGIVSEYYQAVSINTVSISAGFRF